MEPVNDNPSSRFEIASQAPQGQALQRNQGNIEQRVAVLRPIISDGSAAASPSNPDQSSLQLNRENFISSKIATQFLDRLGGTYCWEACGRLASIFAPDSAEHIHQVIDQPNSQNNDWIAHMTQETQQRFDEFYRRFSTEAVILVNPFLITENLLTRLETARPHTLEAIASIIHTFWTEEIANRTDLTLQSFHVSFLADQLRAMPHLERLKITGTQQWYSMCFQGLSSTPPFVDLRQQQERQRFPILEELTSLRSLQIESVENLEIPNLSHLTHLEVLDVQKCDLISIPDCIWTMPALREVILSYNRISAFPDNLSQLPPHIQLYLQGNPLPPLPEQLLQMQRDGRLHVQNGWWWCSML